MDLNLEKQTGDCLICNCLLHNAYLVEEVLNGEENEDDESSEDDVEEAGFCREAAVILEDGDRLVEHVVHIQTAFLQSISLIHLAEDEFRGKKFIPSLACEFSNLDPQIHLQKIVSY